MSGESTSTGRKIFRFFFGHPVALALGLIGLGAVTLSLSYGPCANTVWGQVLHTFGVTVLGAGAFTAVTKAMAYGGIFHDTVQEVISSQAFEARIARILEALPTVRQRRGPRPNRGRAQRATGSANPACVWETEADGSRDGLRLQKLTRIVHGPESLELPADEVDVYRQGASTEMRA